MTPLALTWMLGAQLFFVIALDDGVEFNIDEWESSEHFNTSESVLIYHYRKLSRTERREAANENELLELRRICAKRYGSRLINLRDLNEPHFISVVSGKVFKPYKFSEIRSVILEHGFFVDSIFGSKTVFWICRDNRFLVDLWKENNSKWKGSKGCLSPTEDFEPPDLLCLEIRPHLKSTVTVLLPDSSTAWPTDKRPKDCPSGSHLVAGLSDSPWDVFLIQHRYGLLSGTVLCGLALLGLGCLLLLLVRRSRQLRKQRGHTIAGRHAASPSRTPMLCQEPVYSRHSVEHCKCNICSNPMDPMYHSGSIASASHGLHFPSPERDEIASCHYQAAQCRGSHFASSVQSANSRSSSVQRAIDQGMLVQGQL